jgi:ribosomal protein L12E/L44/L45/RPP1/RPP2
MKESDQGLHRQCAVQVCQAAQHAPPGKEMHQERRQQEEEERRQQEEEERRQQEEEKAAKDFIANRKKEVGP